MYVCIYGINEFNILERKNILIYRSHSRNCRLDVNYICAANISHLTAPLFMFLSNIFMLNEIN